MITTVTNPLDELWKYARAHNRRMRVHRADPVATNDAVFVLEVVDHHGHPLIKVRSKDLQSAARWILDQRRK